jgi:hypothetical protein
MHIHQMLCQPIAEDDSNTQLHNPSKKLMTTQILTIGIGKHLSNMAADSLYMVLRISDLMLLPLLLDKNRSMEEDKP